MKRLAVVVLALVPVLGLAGLAVASSSEGHQLSEVKKATEQFRDVAMAEQAGYGLFKDAAGIACIDLDGVGGMGIHYVNGSLVGDTVLDPLAPESLVYAPGRHGKLELAAVEYIVFAGPWNAQHAKPPSLFGVTFDFTSGHNRYGIPAFYSLHAWIFRANPAGTFTPWNPRVTCPD